MLRIRLTQAEHYACQRAATPDALLLERYLMGARQSSRRVFTVDLAPIGWLLLRERLAPQVFGPRGGLTGPPPTRAALQKVTQETNILARHPAMFGQPVKGYHPGDVQGFRLTLGDIALSGSRESSRKFSPYPYKDRQLVLLRPRHFHMMGYEFTSWSESGGDEQAKHHVDHLVFGCQVHAGRIEHLDGA